MKQDNISEELRSAISALHKRLRKQMYSAETYSITEIETMGLLYRRASLLPSELAALTRVRAQSMSQILKKMEANKIVKKMPAKDDKRKTYILLTASGKKMVEQTRYERDAWLSNAISQTLTQKEKKLLGEALPVLHKLAKAEEATRDNRN